MPLEFDGVNGIIKNTTSDGDVTIKGNDGGSEISALTFDISDQGTATFNHDVKLGDSSELVFGAGNDLKIYHDGSNSFIKDGGTGTLKIQGANSIDLVNGDNTEYLAQFNHNGSVDLYYDSVKKFLTSSTGINLPVDGDSIKFGANSEVVLTHVHNAGLQLSAAGNLDTLKLVSTDDDANVGPVLNYYRNSGNVADNDYIGRNLFTFNNDAPEVETALAQNVVITDASNGSEDVKYIQEQMTAGSIVERFTVSASEAVFNEGSVDVDFRVESNGNTHMLFVDGGNNRVGIGTTPDLGDGLHIRKADSGQGTANANFSNLVIENSAHAGISILTGTSSDGAIYFGDSGGNSQGQIKYLHASDAMQLITGDTMVASFHTDGIVFNENGNDQNFRVESNGVANMFFVDAGNNEVQVSNTGSFYDTDRIFSARQNNNNAGIIHLSTAPSDYANEMITIAGNREESTAEEFIRMNDVNDQQIIFRGDGNGFFDGAADAGNADFAEYFESTDGSVLAIGKTVVLDNGKVRVSTDSDSAADIVGVVRHRKTVGVVGNSAWSKWKGKYKVDDYGVPEYEDYTVTKWTETFTEDAEPLVITYNGETHNHSRIKGGKIDHSYQSDKIPSNLTVPDDAVVVNKDPKGNDLKRKILNDNYDASKEYVSREFRDEWNLIGLTGQVTMTKGQKTGDRWIKMRNISDTVEEWLVR